MPASSIARSSPWTSMRTPCPTGARRSAASGLVDAEVVDHEALARRDPLVRRAPAGPATGSSCWAVSTAESPTSMAASPLVRSSHSWAAASRGPLGPSLMPVPGLSKARNVVVPPKAAAACPGRTGRAPRRSRCGCGCGRRPRRAAPAARSRRCAIAAVAGMPGLDGDDCALRDDVRDSSSHRRDDGPAAHHEVERAARSMAGSSPSMRMGWAPSQRQRRPISGSCSSPFVSDAKWLPASCPTLLEKSTCRRPMRISHSDSPPG